MKILSEHLSSLRELYINQLRQMYSAESQITEALPKLIEAATAPELRAALETHLQETRGQVARVEQILNRTEGPVKSKTNKGIDALLTEGNDIVTDASNPAVRDAAIVGAAQKVEHYEIAAYGTLRRYAEILNQSQDVGLLQQTLQEEKHADEVLTIIADSANLEADRAA
jgi:ferritin-like metal-binding protein YciE